MGQGQVEVVAAEDQVVADGHAVELHLAAFAAADADQREVRRAAADVADEDLLARRDQPVPVVGDGRRSRRKRRPAAPRSAPRAASPARAAALTVSSRATSSNDAGSVNTKSCSASGSLRKPGVPGLADVGQVAAADFDRRKPLDVVGPMPGQQRGRSIHARVTQPRLGRMDQPARHQRPLIAGEEAHGMRRRGLSPREPQCAAGGIRLGGLVVERGQRLAGFDLSGSHQLRHGERLAPATAPRPYRHSRRPNWSCPDRSPRQSELLPAGERWAWLGERWKTESGPPGLSQRRKR